MSTYYAAEHGQDLYFFYPADNLSALRCRIWRKGELLAEETLHSSIKLPFSVFHHNDLLHVFCQDTDGNTLLFANSGEKWSSRTVLQNNDGASTLLTPIVSDDSLCILYNGTDDENTPYLFKRSLATSGQWQDAETIDCFKPFSFAPYVGQSTGPGHLVLFYQIQSEECQVGYREITPGRTGPFHRFLNIKGSLADASYLTTFEDLHILMVVKTALSCQLLYRKKTEENFTTEILLWEAPRIEQCLLTIVDDKLHATCMIGGKPHRAISTDYGDTFGSMSLYKRKFCAEPVKAGFVTQANFTSRLKSRGFFARQIYVDRAAPWDVQMIPDLLPGFYPREVEETVQMQELKNSLAAAQRALDAKDRQIMELMYRSKETEPFPRQTSG